MPEKGRVHPLSGALPVCDTEVVVILHRDSYESPVTRSAVPTPEIAPGDPRSSGRLDEISFDSPSPSTRRSRNL